MPSPERLLRRMDPRASPAQERFARALADLCAHILDSDQSIRTHRAICQALADRSGHPVSEVVFSRQLHARERPRLDLAEALHALAHAKALGRPSQAPLIT